ncbi:MAG: sigma-54-dependent Fis family transcriptional regulator [Deltaproteobacteria bacterium]|nr:sigma-54-dependent Fis family transcriptional regulator [Deltaproteobacteria bacterium]
MTHAPCSYRPPFDADDLDLALLGHSPAVVALRAALATLGRLETNLLLCGETGTGKHACAVALHRVGPRRSRPFSMLSLEGLSDLRIDERLFGACGPLSLAARTQLATVFLDGIESLSRRHQLRLAAALAEAEPPTVRILAGSAASLAEQVRLGRFERGLFDRIGTLQVSLPPLRERREDIALIAPAACERWAERTGLPVKRLGDGALAQLQAYDWPVNVDELLSVLGRACERTHKPVLSADRIRSEIGGRPRRRVARGITPLAQVERAYLLAAVERCGGNQTLAARRLGIGRSTLLRRLRTLGYARPDTGPACERSAAPEALPLSAAAASVAPATWTG